MTAIEDKAAMQKYCEASVGCLQSNLLPHNIHQYKGNYLQGILEAKNVCLGGNGGGSAEPHGKTNCMVSSSVPPLEGYPVDVRAATAAFYPEIQKVHQSPFNVVEARYYPLNCEYGFPVDARVQYAPFRMSSSPNYQLDSPFQDFQYFLVIDFEATCDRDHTIHPQEIIEFPSVLVNGTTGQLEDCFQMYVRPTCHQNLSDFCKELTGIQQNQVDKGVLLGDALFMHDKWLEEKGIKQTNFAVVTWSDWDCRVMLESECRFKKIRKPPYFNRWINLKVPFHEVFGGTRCNLKEAVELAGLVWEGRAHCGLDDATNTARLLSHLMHRGFKFSITNSLMCPPPPQPQPMMPSSIIQYQQPNERDIYCFCGVKSTKRTIRKPGPKHGSTFFGCGSWTNYRGAVCSFFEWSAP